jgi:hypothetical protein
MVSRTSGLETAALKIRLAAATISAGSPAGPTMPCHVVA